MSWNKVLCNHKELQLFGTLNGGQSFRWTHDKDKDEWTGVFSKTVWKLRQNDDSLEYQVLGSLIKETADDSPKNDSIFKSLLKNYFRLDFDLGKCYKKWSDKDMLFKKACKQFYGIRMLNQEPVENLFSFICSQNNHISRISTMVEKLCTHYGDKILSAGDETFYAFPEVEKLSDLEVEANLRKLGFGYRAKFIQKSAAQILEFGGQKWFKSLQDMEYNDARQELMKLTGIGPKVLIMQSSTSYTHSLTGPGFRAFTIFMFYGTPLRVNVDILLCFVADCICLMSLDHLESLPVDTHVYQIAAQNYLPHLRGKKNVTDKMYVEIGDHFRKLYGDKAGWAHTILFCADLKKFQTKEGDENCNEPTQKKKRRK